MGNRAVPDAVRLLARAEAQRDGFREELALAKALLDERELATFSRRCVYCGRPCYGRACAEHRADAQRDPYFNPQGAARL